MRFLGARIGPLFVILATVIGCGGSAPTGSSGEVFFPTWSGTDRPSAIVSGELTERDRCLFLRSDDQEVLALWERGYSYAHSVLLGPSGRPVVREGEVLHGGGGFGSDRRAAEFIIGEPVPQRCRPDGAEPYALIYDVRPGPFID
jgi:hypothetical protein